MFLELYVTELTCPNSAMNQSAGNQFWFHNDHFWFGFGFVFVLVSFGFSLILLLITFLSSPVRFHFVLALIQNVFDVIWLRFCSSWFPVTLALSLSILLSFGSFRLTVSIDTRRMPSLSLPPTPIDRNKHEMFVPLLSIISTSEVGGPKHYVLTPP